MNSSTKSKMPTIRPRRWDTFVSFAYEDHRIGQLLINDLSDRRLSIARVDGSSVGSIGQAVAEAVSTSGSFVMIVSKAGLRSEAAQFEVEVARSSLPDSRIFPVVFSDANPREFPSWLSERHYLHLSDESQIAVVASELSARIADDDHPLLASWLDHAHSSGSRALPDRRPLVGAEPYLNRLCAKRLGTTVIVGPAGTGKTALAAEFVHRERRRFRGVHWFDSSHGSNEPHVRDIRAIEKDMRSGNQLMVVNAGSVDTIPRWVERIVERHALKNRILITARRPPESSRLELTQHDVLHLEEIAANRAKVAGSSISLAEILRWLPISDRGRDSANVDGPDESAEILDRLTLAAFVPDLWVRGELGSDGDESLIALLMAGGWLTARANGLELDPRLAVQVSTMASAETIASIARRLTDLLPPPASKDAISLLPQISRFIDRIQTDDRYFGDAAVRLCVWTGTVWRESGRPQQGVRAAELAIFMSRFRTKSATRLNAFGLAATLATDQGDHHRASQLQKVAIEEAIETLGFDHPLTLATLADLGNTRRHQGRHAEAIATLSHVLARYGDAATPSDPARLTIELNLAMSYREAGLVDQALELLHKTTVTDPELQLRLDQERVAALLAKGEVSEVLPWLQSRVDASESVIGRIEALVRVAGAYEKLGQLDVAERKQEDAVQLCEVHLGPYHPMTLETRQSLALIVDGAGRSLQACDILRDVSTKRGEALGTTHRDYLESVLLWAASSARAGRIDESFALHELAIDQLVRTLGEREIGTLKAREQLLRLKVGASSPGAREGLRSLVDDLENVLPADHPMTRRVRDLLEAAALDPTAAPTEGDA